MTHALSEAADQRRTLDHRRKRGEVSASAQLLLRMSISVRLNSIVSKAGGCFSRMYTYIARWSRSKTPQKEDHNGALADPDKMRREALQACVELPWIKQTIVVYINMQAPSRASLHCHLAEGCTDLLRRERVEFQPCQHLKGWCPPIWSKPTSVFQGQKPNPEEPQ